MGHSVYTYDNLLPWNPKMGFDNSVTNKLYLRSASRAEYPTAAAVVPGDFGLVLRHVEVELLRRSELLTAPGAEQPDSVLKIVVGKWFSIFCKGFGKNSIPRFRELAPVSRRPDHAT